MKNIIKSKISKNIERPNWLVYEKRDANKIWLDKNENTDRDLARFIKKKLLLLEPHYINSYPNLAKLYTQLSRFLKISPKNILLTNGSDGGIKAVYETFINPNDLVLRTEPTFAMYSIYNKIYKTKEILIKYDRQLKLNLNFLLKNLKLKKPKLICLPNPDSPTGQVVDEKSLNSILRIANKSKTIVLIDEAYFEYYKKSFIHKINEYKNLIIARTSGKAYGLSGARIGYLISNHEIIKKLHQTKPMYEVNYIGAQLFYLLLKNNNNNFVKKIVHEHLLAKEYFIKALKNMNYIVTNTYSNFILVDFGLDTKAVLSRLKKVCYIRYFNEGVLKRKVRFALTNIKNFKKILKVINQK